MDGLLAEQAAAIDPQERRDLVDEAVTTLLEEAYGIPLYDSSQVLLVSESVSGLTFPVNSWEPILHPVEKG